MGIPVIGCHCPVCRSTDPRNRRLRTSALLEIEDQTLLIDAGPDLRQQALSVGLARLDAVLITHAHADHVAGLDDLRPLNFVQRSAMPIYGTVPTLTFIRERFAYAFTNDSQGSTRPALQLIEFANQNPFQVGPLHVQPFDVYHGTWIISGFRIGSLGYVTDASAVPPESLVHLRGLDLLVLNALRVEPHPTHFSIAQALDVIEELRPRRVLLVHMAHDVEHETTNALLPDHVRLAYDGLQVEIHD